jgi:hypothetical protein
MRPQNQRSLTVLAIAVLLSVGLRPAHAGKPGEPRRLPPEQRQANMVMLRFQDALASERWEEALALCSDRVRKKAADSPTPAQFFRDTMPIEHVLAQWWGCWSCGTSFYGMFVTLSEHGGTPRLDWYWGLAAKPGGYEVDYPPVKLDEYVAQKKAALQESEARRKTIREALEPKARGVATRLTAIGKRFTIGAPMLFRLELTNAGPTLVHYMDYGARYSSLHVTNEQKEFSLHGGVVGQIGVMKGKLEPHTSTALAEKFDLNQHRSIKKPGRYTVQFGGREVAIGEPQPHDDFEFGRFGEHSPIGGAFGYLTLTNPFPSNVVEIEVLP